MSRIFDRPSEFQTQQSEFTRNIQFAIGEIVINLIWLLIVLLEVILLGRTAIGLIALLLALTVLITHKYKSVFVPTLLGKNDYFLQRIGLSIVQIGQVKLWFFFVLSMILSALALTDNWIVGFVYRRCYTLTGYKWAITANTYEFTFGGWFLWLRLTLIIGLPIVCVVPLSILRYVFHIEQQAPNLRNAPANPIDSGRQLISQPPIEAAKKADKQVQVIPIESIGISDVGIRD